MLYTYVCTSLANQIGHGWGKPICICMYVSVQVSITVHFVTVTVDCVAHTIPPLKYEMLEDA